MKTKTFILLSLLCILLFLISFALIVLISNKSKPGDLLYTVDRTVENARISFSSESAKVSLYLKFADERLDELDALVNDQTQSSLVSKALAANPSAKNSLSPELQRDVNKLVDDYTFNIQKVNEITSELSEKGKNVDALAEKITQKSLEHEEHLLDIYDKVPSQAKPAILKAIEKSRKGHDQALENISKDKKEEIEEKLKDKLEKIKTRIEEKKDEEQEDSQPENDDNDFEDQKLEDENQTNDKDDINEQEFEIED